METMIGAAGDDSPLGALAEIARRRTELASAEAVAVRRARAAGFSWAEIGTMLGVSKQAMHKRYGRHT